MKGSAVGIIAVVTLAVGFGAGFGLRPVLVPVTSATGLAQPTEQEATDAVRRHKLFTGTSLANATLKLFADADHSFHVPARSGRKDAQVLDEVLDTLVAWISQVLKP